MTDCDVQVIHSMSEIAVEDWDRASEGIPFSSHGWYRFGETVLADCVPCYIIISINRQVIARATFWATWNEPMPVRWSVARQAVQAAFRRWPLFICRSPLANASGLVLPEAPLRQAAVASLVEAALQEAKKYNASFLLFDFLNRDKERWIDWPKQFSSYSFSDPGTRMEIRWSSFESYLESLSPKARKHYRQRTREAERLGIKITRHDSVADIEEVLPLIVSVERRHHSTPNPWTRNMLANLKLVNGVWLAARAGGRIVGCETILEDRDTLMVTSLGLADRVSHIYHLLGYADIQYAIERGARFLRWGSGSYDTKRRMGFELENNTEVAFCGLNSVSRFAVRLAS